MEYSFNVCNKLAPQGEVIVLKRLLGNISAPPVVVCVGSDLTVGDSLGPIVGTMLLEKLHGLNVYVYGSLKKPLTAHEIKYTAEFIKNTHPDSAVIAVDAAVGNAGDVGLIKLAKSSLKPGSGANKKLQKIGDLSIMGIVSEKTLFNYSLFTATRLNLVYRMAKIISEGISDYIRELLEKSQTVPDLAV